MSSDARDAIDDVGSVWARDDDASWPRFVRIEAESHLVACGAQAELRAPSSTPFPVALRAADAMLQDAPVVVGAARFAPRLDRDADTPTAGDRWAAFGGAWCFAPRDLVRGGGPRQRDDVKTRDVVLRAHATDAYRAAVSAAIARVHDARDPLHKVVVARAFDVLCTDGRDLRDDVPALIGALAQHVQRAGCGRVFVCAPSRDAIWLGATPERLARIRDGVVHTEAVAGTRPRAAGDDDTALEDALLHDAKELHEHALVVEHLRAQLQRLGLSPTQDDGPRLRRLPQLLHLVTPVRAPLRRGVRAIDVAAALHPTPAMNGTPTRDAAAFLRDVEELDRGLYAGCVGVWRDHTVRGAARRDIDDGIGHDGDDSAIHDSAIHDSAIDDTAIDDSVLDLDVGIRGMLLTPDGARIYAGSGVVVGSTVHGETAETRAKARSVCAALGLRVVREDG